MAKVGKRTQEIVKKLEKGKIYEPAEALQVLKDVASAKFDETVEVAVKLGVDGRQADQQVRGAVALPHGLGKDKRVIVFAKGDKQKEAQEAGADVVGAEDLVAQISGGWLDFDVAIATPDMMGQVGKLGRTLGPKGLMPNPKTGTVTMELEKAVKEFKSGKIEYRLDKASIIHAPIGKVSFDLEKLLDNFNVLMDTLIKAKPAAAKGTYMKSVNVSTTMGPGLKINALKVGTGNQ